MALTKNSSSVIHTNRNRCRDKSSLYDMTPRTTPAFLPPDGKSFWCYFHAWSHHYHYYSVQSKNTYFCFLKVTGQAWESQNKKTININHWYHQHFSQLIWWFIFSFIPPYRKRCGTKLVDAINNLPYKSFLLSHNP